VEIYFRESHPALWGTSNQYSPLQLLQSRGAVVNNRIQFEQWVAVPVEQVFSFFSNPSNLPRIMPPGLRTRLVRLRLMPRSTDSPESSADHPGLAGVGSEIVSSFRIFPWLPWRGVGSAGGWFRMESPFRRRAEEGTFQVLSSSA
jgi:hypothetical protein